jgi:hypothetical protein
MSIILQSSGGGSVTIQEPTTASTLTATLPAATGTVMVSGNMPAFSAYQGSNQSVIANTWTKVLFQTEVFDTNNNFASSTFTPTVAGYYQVNGCTNWGITSGVAATSMYKNGIILYYGDFVPAGVIGATSTVSGLVYCNGSTDYIEIYCYQTNGTNNTTPGQSATYFNGSMVRAA